MREPKAVQSGMRTFPATSGAFSGWAGVVFSVILIVLVLTDDGALGGIPTILGAALFGVVCYAFLLRPRIRSELHEVVLVNPYVTVRIPLTLVSEVRVRSATHVHVGEKRYVGVAVGRKIRQMVRPRGEGAGGGVFGFGGGRAADYVNEQVGSVQEKETVPDLLEQWAKGAISLAKADARLHPDAPDAVRREPAWWLIGLTVAVALAFVVSLFF